MSDLQIFIHRYELIRIKNANSRTFNQIQKGVLVKFQDEQGNYGVADLCPWPTLGDLDLQSELDQQGPLFQRSKELALQDLEARKNKIKLNNGLKTLCHKTLSDFQVIKARFVKIKSDANIYKLSQFLNENHENFEKIRLDFNSCLTEESFLQFCLALSEDVKLKIECVEDPFLFNEEKWKKSTLKCATDFEKCETWPYKICKPSRERPTKNFLYMTSSMDHPVGVAHGLIAAQNYPHLTHGFNTLSFYQETDFHKYFNVTENTISYEVEGYGIGFDQEIQKIIWEPFVQFKTGTENNFFFNPKLDEKNKKDLFFLANHFNKNISKTDYFLISSSGSSQSQKESLKLYAIEKNNFLNSARRVNQCFELTKEMNWGCVLPTFHVGGLAILARSYLLNSKVYYCEWKTFNSEWLIENKIQLMSMIPSQIYDLVNRNIMAPECLKIVFVGAAELNHEILLKAKKLGWPLQLTYGMTETSSMIAVLDTVENLYTPLGEVEIEETSNKNIKIKANSLAKYCLQLVDSKIVIENLIHDSSYVGTDQIDLIEKRFKLIGRGTDQIKINGFNVSLSFVRQRYENILLNHNLSLSDHAIIAYPHIKTGYELLLISTSKSQSGSVLLEYNGQALSQERIHKSFELNQPIPKNELGKIMYSQLQELLQKEGLI